MAARSRGKQELDRALELRGYAPEERAQAIARLEGFGYLDDERFARERALTLLREGRHGETAVREKLLAHGLSPERVDAAVDEARRELAFDPAAAARALLQRRGLLGTRDPKRVARAARLLATRGFSSEVIAALLPSAALDPVGEGD